MMSYHDKCLVCNATRLKPLKQFSANYLYKCNSCGFVFARRIPTEDELIKHYEGYGRNDYLSPITIKRYNELLDELEKYRKTNRILDVGCGIGYFLEEAKKRGWDVYGTEFTDQAISICETKGISMKQGVLDTNNYEPDFFDIITSFEVLEHINNPQDELNNFHHILRKGGLVYFTTPNFNSLLRYRIKEHYDIICYPEHLSYYTPNTVKRLFKKHGFKPLKVQTTGISLTRLRRGNLRKVGGNVNTEKIISSTSRDEMLRNNIENKKYLQLAKVLTNNILTLLGVGDSLKGYFIKK